jgi:hypothetical protein
LDHRLGTDVLSESKSCWFGRCKQVCRPLSSTIWGYEKGKPGYTVGILLPSGDQETGCSSSVRRRKKEEVINVVNYVSELIEMVEENGTGTLFPRRDRQSSFVSHFFPGFCGKSWFFPNLKGSFVAVGGFISLFLENMESLECISFIVQSG